jgi:hypothetical protein
MSWITDIFSSGAGSLVDSVSGLLGKVVTTKGEKMQLDNEIKKAEMQFQEDMAKLSLEEQQMYLQDTSSAREMTEKIQESTSASWMSKNMPYFYDILILLLWASMTVYIILRWLGYIESSPDKKTLDMTGVLGIYSGVTALATMIIQFHRGSSQGSKDKTQIIKNMNQQNS